MPATPPEDHDVDADVGPSELTDQHPSSSDQHPRRHPSDEVLPSGTSDEQEIGWGDEPGGYSDAWYRSERPPHHG
ncbi:MAG: hypothetical protein QOH56_415 [Pseudonocardiales bacterium]|jgi:hypothetical protein|nr:hypothetical protein [Pseudonocardiales bacterium]